MRRIDLETVLFSASTIRHLTWLSMLTTQPLKLTSN